MMTEGMTNWTNQNQGPFNVTLVMTSPEVKVVTPMYSQCLLKEDFVPQDNPHNIINQHAETLAMTFTSGILVPLLTLVGVPGNFLSAAVFYRLGLKERINLCVFSLALVDNLVLCVTVCLSLEVVWRTFVGPASFFIKYFVGLTGFTWVSMFLSAVISSERCFCVVSPLRANRVLTTRTMAVILTSVSTLLLTGLLVIAGHKHTISCVFDPATNTTSDIIYVTEYYLRHKEVFDILDVFLYSTALPFIFLVVIVVTTSITALKLRSASRWRQQTASAAAPSTGILRDTREVALTKMLIATSLLFIVCLCPMLLVQVAMFIVPELKYGGYYHNMTSLLWSIIPAFRCLNSSLNFFVYYHLGSRFRRTLRSLVLCKKGSGSREDDKTNSVETDHRHGRKVHAVNSVCHSVP